MSTPASSAPSPAPDQNAGQLAQEFVAAELQRTRAALKKAQIVAVVLLLFVGGYMGFLTTTLLPYLTPQGAAAVANDQIYNQVMERAPLIADTIKQQVPGMVARIPDIVLEKLPEWREQVEDKVEQTMVANLQSHSEQFGKHLDGFLTLHKDQIAELLEAANDTDKLKVVMTAIEQDVLEFLGEKFDDGKSIREQLDTALQELTRLEGQMNRLANAKDLTPQEQKTRRAIAIISRKIDLKRI